MLLAKGHHLAYCTNIHRGETWAETLQALETYTLEVKHKVCPSEPYAIGLRLSAQAARELSDSETLLEFQRWLEVHHCYVFTINGFPFGRFHGQRVKEQVYRPDWTSRERLDYTNLLFDILAQLVPAGVEGSVSTLPGSFKEFIQAAEQEKSIRDNLFECVKHIERCGSRSGRTLHLGLEPEPLGLFETTPETIAFFGKIREEHPNDPRLEQFLGVNYDTCHLAVEYEDPIASLSELSRNQIKISKIHLSSALKARATPAAHAALAQFSEDVYLHQVVARDSSGELARYRDLGDALSAGKSAEEWRVHFHVPLHGAATDLFEPTTDHLLGTLDALKTAPGLCRHLEMETYTWEVLPSAMRSASVVEQLCSEYQWCLEKLNERGLGLARPGNGV